MKHDRLSRCWHNTCPTGKRGFPHRAGAKAAARHAGGHMRPYRCGACGCWHMGHLPGVVLRGQVGASDWYQAS